MCIIGPQWMFDFQIKKLKLIMKKLGCLTYLCHSSLSNQIVTGPELSSSTSMRAPNTPPATFSPYAATVSLKRSTRDSAIAGGAASFARIGVKSELRDDEHLAAGVEQ